MGGFAMKQASLGFLAGMVFMAAVVTVEIWGLTPRIDTTTEYGTGVAVDSRDC
jgi:hypothetical protein